MWRVYVQRPAARSWTQWLLAPSWPTRAGLVATALILFIPVIVLALVGAVVGVLVFAVLSLLAHLIALPMRLTSWMVASLPADEGRQNVRVIHRE